MGKCSGITKLVLVIGLGMLCLAANGTSTPLHAAGAGPQLPYPPGERFLIHPPVKPGDHQQLPDISGNIVVWLENSPYGPYQIYGYNLLTGEHFDVVTDTTKVLRGPRISGDNVIWNVEQQNALDIFGRNLSSGLIFPILTQRYWYDPGIDGNTIVTTGPEDKVWLYDLQAGQMHDIAAPAANFPEISDGLVTWQSWRQEDGWPVVAIYNVATGETRLLDTNLFIHDFPNTNHRWVLVDASWGSYGLPGPGVTAYNWDTGHLYKVSNAGNALNIQITDDGVVVWNDDIHMYSYDMNSGARCILNACYDCLLVSNLRVDGNIIVWNDRVDPSQAQNAIYGMIVPTHDLAGDINCDNIIDAADLKDHVARWHMYEGDAHYLPGYDRDKDGQIDIRDLMLLAQQLTPNY